MNIQISPQFTSMSGCDNKTCTIFKLPVIDTYANAVLKIKINENSMYDLKRKYKKYNH